MLKIIISSDDDSRDMHARALVMKSAKDQPRGVTHTLAMFPTICGTCGQTYWTKDEYGFELHAGCRGSSSPMGFNA